MVKLHKRVLRQRYKRKKSYEYTRYTLEFPAKFNNQIHSLTDKKFEINLCHEDTSKHETLKIYLTRKKTTQDNNDNYYIEKHDKKLL